MLLRFLLVTVVTGLGFELPSRDEVSAWSRTGRDWIQARVDDFSGARLVAHRRSADAEFAGVVDDMARDFSADLAMIEAPKPSARLAFEPIEVRDEPASELIASFDYAGQGVGMFVELVGPPSALAVAEVAPAPVADGPSRANRLASAIRLTGQAASAWASLLNGAEPSSIRR